MPSPISCSCHLFLQGLLADEQVSGAPILVLGNKIDKPGAASEEELRTLFNLHSQTTGKVDLCFCYKGEEGGEESCLICPCQFVSPMFI